MKSIEEIKKKRFQFLNRVYELTGGSQFNFVNMCEIGKELDFDNTLTDNIAQYLVEEGLIEHQAFGGIISITHNGIREVEEALSNPDKPTTYFPPVNIIHVNQMTNSQIVQSSPGATLAMEFAQEKYDELKEVLQALKESIDQFNLQTSQKSDLQADIQTIEAQMLSSKPKATIIRESLSSIRRILEGAVGSTIASSLLSKILALLGVS